MNKNNIMKITLPHLHILIMLIHHIDGEGALLFNLSKHIIMLILGKLSNVDLNVGVDVYYNIELLQQYVMYNVLCAYKDT